MNSELLKLKIIEIFFFVSILRTAEKVNFRANQRAGETAVSAISLKEVLRLQRFVDLPYRNQSSEKNVSALKREKVEHSAMATEKHENRGFNHIIEKAQIHTVAVKMSHSSRQPDEMLQLNFHFMTNIKTKPLLI